MCKYIVCLQAQKSFERCLHLDPSNREVRTCSKPLGYLNGLQQWYIKCWIIRVGKCVPCNWSVISIIQTDKLGSVNLLYYYHPLMCYYCSDTLTAGVGRRSEMGTTFSQWKTQTTTIIICHWQWNKFQWSRRDHRCWRQQSQSKVKMGINMSALVQWQPIYRWRDYVMSICERILCLCCCCFWGCKCNIIL